MSNSMPHSGDEKLSTGAHIDDVTWDDIPDTRHALCCECGEVRTIGARTAWQSQIGTRSLKCRNCRRATPHVAVLGRPDLDWREYLNRQVKPTVAESDQEWLLQVDVEQLEAMGVRCYLSPRGEKGNAVVVRQFLDDGQYVIQINTDHPASSLRWILARLLPLLVIDDPFDGLGGWFVRPAKEDSPPLREAFFGAPPGKRA